MSLLTCKKYVFLIEKNFPPHPKIGKTQHNDFLWVALENSAQRFPMGRVGKLNTTLSYGSRWKTQHNAFLWVALENSTQRFPMGRVVGLVMVKGVLLSSLASIPFALYRIHVSKKN
ncbi:hypothetical protein LEP1GSC096_2380 [Leptospira interrogans serovar Hebdomadis str. R499]|nr:hypothetical protein LEP1GSC096_2380 [Leptospira interrogans serovar Hebdomadis str. R499]